MATQKRLIGENYDHEKFDNGFRRAAYAMVAESYTSPDSPAGRTLQHMFFDTMKLHMAKIPTEYYQVLETFADGGELDGLAEGSTVEAWHGAGDEKLAKLMMEIVTGAEEAELRLCDPTAAERYYDERFAEKELSREHTVIRKRLDLSAELSRGNTRTATMPLGRERQKEHNGPERS